MKSIFKNIVYSYNDLKSAARFKLINYLSLEHGILYKTANLIAAEKVEGDYLEFGVYSGGSFIEAYTVLKHAFGPHQKIHGERTSHDKAELKRLWSQMRFFAFDSFQGLPDLQDVDKEARDFAKGKYTCSEEKFCKNIARAGVPLDKVVRVPGLFNQTCTRETIEKYNIRSAAVVHIDCDLYTSTKTALEFIKPLLTDGTIIIFDDWFCFRGNPNLGEQKAFHEWKETMPGWIFSEYQRTGPWTNSFIASKRIHLKKTTMNVLSATTPFKEKPASLTREQVQKYEDEGFLVPVRVLSAEKAAALCQAVDEHLLTYEQTPKYELTDPIRIKRNVDATGKKIFEFGDGQDSKPKTFPFLFNLWKRDKRFEEVAKDPAIARIASQLLGGKRVHLLEDNVIVKNGHAKSIPWHQDFPYWPLATPTATTIFIALDAVTPENGSMQVVPGSHKRTEETLPVQFGDDKSIMQHDRPNAVEISQNPAADGLPVVDYGRLEPGECGIHHALTWHGSGPNLTSMPRRVLTLRYVAEGTIWLGNERFPYDEVGINPGDIIGGEHFPLIPVAEDEN